MDIETITKLIDCGFTKEEIMKLTNTDPEPAPSPEPEPEPTTSPEPAPSPEPEKSSDEIHENVKALTATVEELVKTVKAMQKSNAKRADGGKPERIDSGDVIRDFFSKS